MNVLSREPVMKAAGVPAILVLGYTFWKTLGFPAFTPEQENAFWPFVAALLPLLTGFYARRKVEPVQ